jgi:pimeloyl-ACP methyl ester carboxylesterase
VTIERLPTGGDVRISNEEGGVTAVLVNGGTAKPVPGTWSATSELLVRELAPRFPAIRFVEVRYRLKSWRALDSCVADGRAALTAAGRARTLLIGFSLGGAVAVRLASTEGVTRVLGLAPWLPPELTLDGLRGKRLDIVHGSWDWNLPGIPGVSPAHSRAGWERARRLGVPGTYTVIPRGLHGCALRSRRGGLVRLPRWHAWVVATAARLADLSG